MLDLVIQGGPLPTFLLDRLVQATGATRVEPRAPQLHRLYGVTRPADFTVTLEPLLAAEKLDRRGIALRDVWAPGTFKDFTAYAEAEYRAECDAAREAMKGDVA